MRIFYAVCVTAKLTFSFTMAHELHIHVVPWSCMHPTLHIPLMIFGENLSLRKQKLLQVFSHMYNTFKYDSSWITIPFTFVLKTPCHLRNMFFSFSVLLKTRFCTDGFFYIVSDSDVLDFPVSHKQCLEGISGLPSERINLPSRVNFQKKCFPKLNRVRNNNLLGGCQEMPKNCLQNGMHFLGVVPTIVMFG